MKDDEGGPEARVPLTESEELERARALLRAIGLKDWPSEEELAASVVTFHMTPKELVRAQVGHADTLLREVRRWQVEADAARAPGPATCYCGAPNTPGKDHSSVMCFSWTEQEWREHREG